MNANTFFPYEILFGMPKSHHRTALSNADRPTLPAEAIYDSGQVFLALSHAVQGASRKPKV